MSAVNPIRIGIIGAGNIANVHILALKNNPDFVLAGVTDSYLPLAELRAAEHGIPKIHASAEGLIADANIDAVIICVPNQFHAPIAIQALKAGKHVLLEKPMGIDLPSAKQILETQRESGKVLMVSQQMRWASIPQQIKEQVDKGALGRIYNAKAGWLRRKGIPGWGTWFTQKELSGGGPLIDIGVHLLDLSLYLMGNPKPVSVYGTTYAEMGPRKKGIGSWGVPNWNGIYDVEDLATALIKMEDGSTLSLDVSWAAHLDTDSQPFIHLLGTEGGASYRGNSGKLLMESFDRAAEVPLTVPDNNVDERIKMNSHFVECILDGKEPLTSALSGFTNNLILDAIYQSSRTGNEIKLDWDL